MYNNYNHSLGRLRGSHIIFLRPKEGFYGYVTILGVHKLSWKNECNPS